MESHLFHSHRWEEFIYWNVHIIQNNLQMQWNLYHYSNGIFHRNRINNPAKILKTPKQLKEEQNWQYHTARLQNISGGDRNQNSMVLASI